jgi:mannose-6-phosphate isomerase-like protein (cupin superfamily)
MVKIFKLSDSETKAKKGYTASYVADVEFQNKLDSGGFILVSIEAGEKSEPHAHGHLEEIFVAMSDLSMRIDDLIYDINKGDVILVSPNEYHSFEAPAETPAQLLAIKFPNLKTDNLSS